MEKRTDRQTDRQACRQPHGVFHKVGDKGFAQKRCLLKPRSIQKVATFVLKKI